jgi:hypothetical protein
MKKGRRKASCEAAWKVELRAAKMVVSRVQEKAGKKEF